jgi:acyl-CoA thioester hydrolase
LKHNHFSKEIIVEEKHLDNLLHVNNVVYVQWMQDIALQHWKTFASTQIDETYVWMVHSHQITYHAQAFKDDILLMQTYTGNYSNVTWDRHYEITRPADGKKIITAKSVWILLNRKTQRPQRVDDDILNVFS